MDRLRLKTGRIPRAKTLLASWPGMGNVALGAVRYLRRSLGAGMVASVEVGDLVSPDAVTVESGLATLPTTPGQMLYHAPRHGLMFFEGDAQIAGPAAGLLIDALLDFCQKAGVTRIYTGASFPLPMSHHEPASVYAAATSQSLLDQLTRKGIHTMTAGHISGLNGLLLGYAARRGIQGACLLATIPVYAVSLPNPKAFRALAEILASMLALSVDFAPLEPEISDMGKKLDTIESKLGELSIEPEDLDEEPSSPPLVPSGPSTRVLRRIERLFEEVRADRKKAYLLKQELDRWDLYGKYEDRFLDLFQQSD